MRNERQARTASVYGYNPRIIAVASYVLGEGATPYPFLVEFLETIDTNFPGLTFTDFIHALRLLDLVHQRPGGNA